MEQSRKQTTIGERRKLLQNQKTTWILKLKTLYSDRLNQEVNDIA